MISRLDPQPDPLQESRRRKTTEQTVLQDCKIRAQKVWVGDTARCSLPYRILTRMWLRLSPVVSAKTKDTPKRAFCFGFRRPCDIFIYRSK